MVMWEGRVLSHVLNHCRDRIVLGTAAGKVVVPFARAARNLEYDRTGYRVASKGKIRLKNGHFSHLEGQSAILLEPPLRYRYSVWLGGDKPSLESYLAWRIEFHNPERSLEEDMSIARSFVAACRAEKLDPLFLAALIQIESAWDVDAVSVSGAQGLGQLMPRTAQGLGVSDPLDPRQNLAGASKMVAGLLRTWAASPNPRAAVLASYNAGPTRVKAAGGRVPYIAETTNYVYFIGYVYRDACRMAKAGGVI